MTVQYQVAADMAIILKYGDADQSVVAGLNTLQGPGLSRSEIEVQEFRNDFSRKFAGGASTQTITYGGNFVIGNDKGQTQLLTYCKNNTKFTDCRIYLNYITSNLDSDFWAPDTAQDSSTGLQVLTHTPGNADINGVIPFEGSMVLNGQYALFDTHYTADTIAFVDSNPDTITDSASGFVTAGFVSGQTLIVEGTSSNDGIYIINTVVAGTITLTAAGSLSAEGAGSDFTLHGGL